MKTPASLTMLATAALLLGAGFLSARLVQDDVPEMKRYVLGLIYSVEGRDELPMDEVMALQAGHLENIGRLVGTGEMVLAGPCEGDGALRGLFIYDVPSLERAQELVDSDPAVAAGRLRVELHGWWGPSLLSGMLSRAKEDALHGEHEQHDADGHERGDHDGEH